jgi:PTH1 family peptidyl-tRNA hydrolase
LGNIGREYFNTRHNIGFDFIDLFSSIKNIDMNKNDFDGIIGTGIINGEKLILAKPTTYMNLSGKCVRQILDYYKIDTKDIIVIYDDISLDVGKIRIRPKGSAGGHNGIKSIISHLGTEDFPRVRIGIGNKLLQMDLADYVLGKFNEDERLVINKTLNISSEAIECIINNGIEKSMNKYNSMNII